MDKKKARSKAKGLSRAHRNSASRQTADEQFHRDREAFTETRYQREAGKAKAPFVVTPSRTLLRAPHSEALKVVFANALADHEGESSGAVGSMRFGKTYWLQEILEYGFANGVWSRAFIHDVKKAVPQFEGAVCASALDYTERIEALENERTIVFHAADFRARPTLQDVCEVALTNLEALEGEEAAIVVVADEVFKGTNGFGGWLQGPPEPDTGKPAPALFPLYIREGTSQRISDLWSTQIPQQLPTECKVLSRTVAQFHLEGLAAQAACDHFRLTSDGETLLASLRRGEFILFCQNQNWNRTIYVPEESL